MTDNQIEIRLRALEPDDLDRVYRWENDPELWPDGNTLAPLSRFQLNDYIRSYSADIYRDRQLRLMIELSDGTSVGLVDLFDFEPENSRISIGIYVDAAYRRKGIAFEAIDKIKRYCRERLSINMIWCIISHSNTPSLKLFKKHGFTVSGTLKSWLKYNGSFHDAYLLQSNDK